MWRSLRTARIWDRGAGTEVNRIVGLRENIYMVFQPWVLSSRHLEC